MSVEEILERYNQGQEYEAEGDLTGAVMAYTEALVLDIEKEYSSMLHFSLGVISRRKRQTASAIKEFEQSLDDSPTLKAEEYARNQLAQMASYNLGSLIFDIVKHGDKSYKLEDAEKHFHRALEIPVDENPQLLTDARTNLEMIKKMKDAGWVIIDGKGAIERIIPSENY